MKVPFDIYQDGVQFFLKEAEIIDNGKFRDWLDFMAEDFTYKIPIRITREKAAPTEFSELAFHMDETKSSMELRVERSFSEYNWAEDPASRTRHFLTNFRASKAGSSDTEIDYRINFLIYRGKFDSPKFQFLSGERQDKIRLIDGEWRLSKRLILLDHTTVPMNNLAIFI